MPPFGLILSKKGAKKKKKKAATSTSALFAAAAAEAVVTEEDSRRAVNAGLQSQAQSLQRRKLAERAQAEALAQDSTVYDYDGVYDQISTSAEAKRSKSAAAVGGVSKSKYIEQLLQQAKEREFAYDKAQDRKAKREQEEEEQELGKPTEAFVTGAYQRKLEERKVWEAEQKRKAEEEARNDVTKKTENFASGFYSHLLCKIARPGAASSSISGPDSTMRANNRRNAVATVSSLDINTENESQVKGGHEINDAIKSERGGLVVVRKPNPTTTAAARKGDAAGNVSGRGGRPPPSKSLKVYQPGELKRKREEREKNRVAPERKASVDAVQAARERAKKRREEKARAAAAASTKTNTN